MWHTNSTLSYAKNLYFQLINSSMSPKAMTYNIFHFPGCWHSLIFQRQLLPDTRFGIFRNRKTSKTKKGVCFCCSGAAQWRKQMGRSFPTPALHHEDAKGRVWHTCEHHSSRRQTSLPHPSQAASISNSRPPKTSPWHGQLLAKIETHWKTSYSKLCGKSL